jgi:REP element-mobilizing transposase RayT
MAKFDPDEYRHEGNAVYELNYHFVFIPKRRKKVLFGKVADRFKLVSARSATRTDGGLLQWKSCQTMCISF